MHSKNGPTSLEGSSVRKSFAELLPIIAGIRNPKCTACALHEGAFNVCVMGRPGIIPLRLSLDGNESPKIMLIGEAPGAREDAKALPFVGRAGKRLQDALTALNMDQLCWITNICKCRPPRNRAPVGTEMDTCVELYLNSEIELVNPVLIVLMGSVAASMYLKEWVKGEIYQIAGSCPMMVVHHPSYFNHSGDEKAYSTFRNHLQKAKDYALKQTTIERIHD